MGALMLILLRGLPGSGKSTLADHFGSGSFAADDFFVGDDGVYRFDPAGLPEAHKACQDKTEEELGAGRGVTVANTFSQRWEMEPYLEMGAEHGARVFVVDLFDGGLTDGELFERNTHCVPLEGIVAMRQRWEHDYKVGNPLPPWER